MVTGEGLRFGSLRLSRYASQRSPATVRLNDLGALCNAEPALAKFRNQDHRRGNSCVSTCCSSNTSRIRLSRIGASNRRRIVCSSPLAASHPGRGQGVALTRLGGRRPRR